MTALVCSLTTLDRLGLGHTICVTGSSQLHLVTALPPIGAEPEVLGYHPSECGSAINLSTVHTCHVSAQAVHEPHFHPGILKRRATVVAAMHCYKRTCTMTCA